MDPVESLRVLRIAVDTWRTERAGAEAIRRRQQERLCRLVRHARTASPYYRRLYHGLPPRVADPLVLPPVGKHDLMAHFDEWVTDPEVTLDGIRQDFLSDLSRVGSAYLGRYHVFTTSGTTGEPAILLHDRASWQVMHVVSRFRARGSLGMGSLLPQLRRRGIRSAACSRPAATSAGWR